MRALISGQAGVAVLLDENPLYAVVIDDPEERRAFSWGQVRSFFAETEDLFEIVDISHKQAIDALEVAWAKDRALQLTLMLLDPAMRVDTRTEAAECVEELFATSGVEEFVADRLYCAPLPAGKSDLGGAIVMAVKAPGLARLLTILSEKQDQISALRRSWDNLPLELFAGSQSDSPRADKSHAEEALIAIGAFRRVAETIADGFEEAVEWCLKATVNQPVSRQVVQAWIQSGRLGTNPH